MSVEQTKAAMCPSIYLYLEPVLVNVVNIVLKLSKQLSYYYHALDLNAPEARVARIGTFRS